MNKRKHTRNVTEIIESSDPVYRGNWIVILQSRVASTFYILSKEQHPRLLAHSMPEGLIFWHKATAETRSNLPRPYRRLQDDVLFWQNFDLEHIKEWLRRNHLTTKEAVAGIAEEIYNGCNSVRSAGTRKVLDYKD